MQVVIRGIIAVFLGIAVAIAVDNPTPKSVGWAVVVGCSFLMVLFPPQE